MAHKEEKDKEPFDLKKEILSWVYSLGAALIITFLIITFIAQVTNVDGRSMNDTLQDRDRLIVEKVSYRFGNPDRFDVIVFRPKCDPESHYIKRVIGLPGETVQIDTDGVIYIDGDVLEEDYGKETILNPGRAIDPITLGEDEFFVLGDNRNNSTDGRFEAVGNVTKDSITGRAIFRIWPISSIGTFR